ncbi:hypothetical protein BKA93DRAFT_217972 [Sparassis latifolia]
MAASTRNRQVTPFCPWTTNNSGCHTFIPYVARPGHISVSCTRPPWSLPASPPYRRRGHVSQCQQLHSIYAVTQDLPIFRSSSCLSPLLPPSY